MKPPLAILLFLGATLITACATDVERIPPLSRLKEIRLSAGPGWSLSIGPDGSAAIGYGSNGSDFASVPAGTFDFEQVYRSLAPVVRPTGNMRESFTVAFYEREVTIGYSLYTDNANVILDLFTTAKQKCVPPDKARIDELWERQPPSLNQ